MSVLFGVAAVLWALTWEPDFKSTSKTVIALGLGAWVLIAAILTLASLRFGGAL